MANDKIVALEQLNIVKEYIDTKNAAAVKSAEYANNTIKLFTTADKSGDPVATFNLPEEMFLDQAKTVFVPEFSWTSSTYPGTEDPNLDRKPVLVLAVRGDDESFPNYSFIPLEALTAKVSKAEGNSLTLKEDGFYVPPIPEQAVLTYATNDEVQALFS